MFLIGVTRISESFSRKAMLLMASSGKKESAKKC
jgi:hypothetical protein